MVQHTYSLPITVVGILSIAFALLIDGSYRYDYLPAHLARVQTVQKAPAYQRTLRFNVYTFTVETPDTGTVGVASIKAWRGQLLLTNFTVRIDGPIAGAEVADLDGNRFPELYIFSQSTGSGSFGRVYGWQFLPERKANITPLNWQLSFETGYMGHDSLWLERGVLCRQFPRYQPGDANASPSGGTGMMRYQLRPTGQGFVLKEL